MEQIRFSKMIEKELLLTARKNLPEHLRVLAEKYPALVLA